MAGSSPTPIVVGTIHDAVGTIASRRSGLPQIPPQSGECRDAFARWRDQEMLVRAVLLAAIVAVRDPNQSGAEVIDEHVARQSTGRVRDDLNSRAQRLLHGPDRPAYPRGAGIGTAGGHANAGVLDADVGEALGV